MSTRSRETPRWSIIGDDLARLRDRAFDIEGQIGIDFGRDAAGHELRQFRAEIDRKALGDAARRSTIVQAPEDRLLDQILMRLHLPLP